MAFWSTWFAPKCDDCAAPIVGTPPLELNGRKRCAACHDKALAAEAQKLAEIEERRQAEEAARRRFEDSKQFGATPRPRPRS